MYVDLGAEQLVTAQKADCQIAVEIKSFIGNSMLRDMENAVGQYFVYRAVMTRTEPNRKLYVAIHNEIFVDIFEEPLGRLMLEDYQIPLIVFDIQAEAILRWIPYNPIAD